MIGAAAYSRGSGNSDGLGKACSGNSPDKDFEDGVCDIKTLPRPGATEYYDEECQAAYSYDATKRIFNSYDNERSAAAKAQYVLDHGLKGIIIWEASGDFPADHPKSIINAINRVFTTGKANTSTSTPSSTVSPSTSTTVAQTQSPIPEPLAGSTPQNQLPVPTTSTTSKTCCDTKCKCCQNCPCHNTATQTALTTTTQTATKPPANTTTTTTNTTTATPEWKQGVNYTIGARVTYQGRTYQCINKHTSQSDWTPSTVPSLWKVV